MKNLKTFMLTLGISLFSSITVLGNTVASESEVEYDDYINNESEIIQEIIDSIPDTVELSKVSTEKEAELFIKQYFSSETLTKYHLSFSINYYGDRFSFVVSSDDGKDYFSFVTVVLDNESEKLLEEITTDCENVISELEISGLDMSIANTKIDVLNYIKSLVNIPDNMELELFIYDSPSGLTDERDFQSAIGGTKSNKNGVEGHFYLSALIKFNGINSYTNRLHSDRITILPVKYSGSLNTGSSGSSDRNVIDNGLIINNSNVFSGKWKHQNDNWYLLLDDGSLAQSQWANLNDHWYVFDDDGNMITSWQKVDGKWYYFNSDGSMVTGWKEIGNQYYYFDLSSGHLLINTTTPDGYVVDQTGKWIK